MLAHCNLELNMCLCSKQSCLFSFYALPSGGKSKDMVVHYAEKCKQRGAREEMEKSVPLGFQVYHNQWTRGHPLPFHAIFLLSHIQLLYGNTGFHTFCDIVHSMLVGTLAS